MQTTTAILAQLLTNELDRIDTLIHPAIRITEKHARQWVRQWAQELTRRHRAGEGITKIHTDQGRFNYTTYGIQWETRHGKLFIRAINQDTAKPWRNARAEGAPSAIYADLAELIEDAGETFMGSL